MKLKQCALFFSSPASMRLILVTYYELVAVNLSINAFSWGCRVALNTAWNLPPIEQRGLQNFY